MMRICNTCVLALLAALSLLGPSCSDVFEENLSTSEVTLLGPADENTIHSGTIEFWWEELEGAETYQLKVVGGSFDQPESLETDTALSNNVFALYLGPGSYEWQVIASNQSSEAISETFSLVVDSLLSLESEKVVLLSPTEGNCTNDTALVVQWLELEVPGIRYSVDIRLGDFDEGLTLYAYETEATSISTSISPAFEGELSWGVRAINDNGASPYSQRSLNLDLTAPSQPSLVSPAAEDSVQHDAIDLAWQGSIGSGCSEYDSVFIYADSLGAAMTAGYEQAAGINALSIDVSIGTYWWGVTRLDQAGNRSTPSPLRKLHAID